MKYLLGIDISTTSAKALLIDATGKVIATRATEIPLSTPKPLWSEQNPADWWQGVLRSIQALMDDSRIAPSDIAAVGLTGQMHGLTMLDEKGEVIRPAILWNDQRTGKQCEDIHTIFGREKFLSISGNVALTGFTAPKVLWVKQNEPEAFKKCRHILLPKDYIRYKLSGTYASDRAGGSGTVLFDIKHRDWSSEIMTALGIPGSWLPKTFEGTEITGTISAEAAALTGLLEGTPIVGGGGDQAAGAVGMGAVLPGIVSLTLGTSGVIFATTDNPYIEEQGRLHSFCHAMPGRWHLMGVMLSAAGSLKWFHDNVAPAELYDDFLNPTTNIPLGAEGLYFLPYLTGERTPYPDPLARGAFIGLTLRHTIPHMTRAVLEGVAFGLRDSFELMKKTGLTDIHQVRVSGGGAKSPIWRQILANVLNVELVTVNTSEGGAFGAALCAGVGAGIWKDIDQACDSTISLTGSTKPNPESVAQYERCYQVYSGLYTTLKDTFFQIHQAEND
ncbi:MAG: xylulokinase [Anaerolineae bacterium]|jgi:xylulokinase|nr:xylulokinase [Anaerolineae bacterium]